MVVLKHRMIAISILSELPLQPARGVMQASGDFCQGDVVLSVAHSRPPRQSVFFGARSAHRRPGHGQQAPGAGVVPSPPGAPSVQSLSLLPQFAVTIAQAMLGRRPSVAIELPQLFERFAVVALGPFIYWAVGRTGEGWRPQPSRPSGDNCRGRAMRRRNHEHDCVP